MNKNMHSIHSREAGAVSGAGIAAIVLLLMVIVLGSVMVWALVNYADQKDNVDAKIAAAVLTAKKEQSAADEKIYQEKEKEPLRQIIGPDDLGKISFSYPKTWSVYVGKQDATSYEAYMYPGVVPPVGKDTPYAARITVENRAYDTVVKSFDGAIKKGELKSTAIEVNGLKGNRLDGTFSKSVQGSMVIFKIRDKTARVYTESKNYQSDFDNTIVKTLTFNP